MACRAFLAALIACAALVSAAHAEGGLPGSPRATRGDAQDAAPTSVAVIEPHDASDASTNLGGAVLSPFSRTAAETLQPREAVAHEDGRESTPAWIIASVLGVFAIAWLLYVSPRR